MHSFIIIADNKSAKNIANSIAPYKIEKVIDNLFVDVEEKKGEKGKKDKIGISSVRKIKKFLQTKPYENTHKIIYINNSHLLTPPAQNSLLKTLEEPPDNSLIFLVTTNIDKLLPTVISRCQIVKDDQIIPIKTSPENQFIEVEKSLINLNPGQKITLAAKFAYPKTKAKSFCKDSIYYLKSLLKENPTNKTATNLKLAHTTLLRLENNVDPKLSLEHFFLHFKT